MGRWQEVRKYYNPIWQRGNVTEICSISAICDGFYQCYLCYNVAGN